MRWHSEVWSDSFIRTDEDQDQRHLLGISHFNALFGTDPHQNEAFVKLGSQTAPISKPLDSALKCVLRGED